MQSTKNYSHRYEPSSFNDFHTSLKKSSSIENLEQRIVKNIKQLGFSHYSFAPLDFDWEQKDEDQQAFLSSYPEEYWRIFQEDKLYTFDMLISFFKDNVHPIFTSQVYDYYCNAPLDTQLTRANRAIRQLQHSFGFYESYVIPVTTTNGRFLLTISRQNMSATDFQCNVNNMGAQLRLLGQAIGKVCDNQFRSQFQPPQKKVIDIAPKPLLVLATLANNDLSITDVASKLCISPITAHQHIAVARKAFGKGTNIGAIKAAIQLGLIEYTDDIPTQPV